MATRGKKKFVFVGGCKTAIDVAQLPIGEYSMVQNMRNNWPGFEKRKGQIKLHTSADSTNRVMSLYQYSKGKKSENHVYAQMSDSDVLEATNAPPTVTTGVFGTEVFSGTASPYPASWANMDDLLLFSNGVDQHKIFTGTARKVDKFIVYKGTAAPPAVPTQGEDYSDEVRGVKSGNAILDSLGDLAVDYDCLFVGSSVPFDTLTWTIPLVNGSVALIAANYRKNDSTWAAVTSFVDNTDSPAAASIFTDAMSATANWTAVTAILSSVAGGQTGNCLQVASDGANLGKAYHDVTTVVSQKYWFKCYFKKGTSANGKIMIGTTADEDAIYDSGNLADADWTLHETEFTATATTTRITLQTNDATDTENSLFDTLSTETGVTLAQAGTMTWTMPTDWIPSYMYGANLYWAQLYLSSGALDAEVEVSALTFESDWLSIENVWDGIPVEAIEAQFYDVSATNYYTYGSTAIDISSMQTGDILYVSTYDLPMMMYVDVMESPSTTGSVTLVMTYYDGAAWQSMTIVDGSSGFQQSGWVTFARPTLSKMQNFNKTQYYAHWFKLTVSAALSATTTVGISFAPYFDVDEIGKGLANCAWKGRMVYSTNTDHYMYVTAQNNPQILNGIDYGMLEPGDGRPNLPVAMRRYKNEIMVWQEEKGTDGGCLTLFEGYTPVTFGKLVLSTKIGTMNNNSVDIVEGVLTSTRTDDVIKDLAYCLSRYGVYVTDGMNLSIISDDIQNYFDPTDTTNCIRRGYEKLMWLKHDSAYNVIRIGLVCGSSATVPNVFPVYDITTRTWSFDVLGQALACMAEVAAGSGDIPVLQIGGGTADGFVYLLNNSTNDVSTAIDSYVTPEFGGDVANIRGLTLRCKAQSAGNITLTPSINAIAQTAKTLSMIAEITNQTTRRHKFNLNLTGYQMSLKLQNATASQSMSLYDYEVELDVYEEQ